MSFGIAGTMAVIAAYGAYSSGVEQNKASNRAIKNANQRYAIDSSIAANQTEEQNMMALEQMTDVTRQFLQAKGKAKAIQAETMVGGNVQKRLERDLSVKESETKGRIAKEINTNVINIAQGMIANKIDTDALVQEALSKRKSGLSMITDMTLAAGQAGLTGYQLGSSLSKPSAKTKG